ncbi:MAG: DNA polymerase IV [Clostridia bacterium]|nr:DNA polymerase IV [Clostridia bacterium]
MRDILHCDLNNFYASCEMLENPELKDYPLAVGGSETDRHGIVLAKNYLAKAKGIQTGMTLYQAKKLCPNIVFVEPHFDLYSKYSKMVREILLRYTDRVEPFSIDESWLDVTHSKIFGTPKEIADKIRQDVKRETGLTVSVGVSFNKIFSKLGSDLKKPDATTCITRDNFKEIVWKLEVDNLLGIGKQTALKLKKYGIDTIGDLANTDKSFLENLLGKVGTDLYNYANGEDDTPIEIYNENYIPKSVGNSTTFYKNLTNLQEIELGFTVLCENVVARMIRYNLDKAKTLMITVKDKNLQSYTKQTKLKIPSRDSILFTDVCMDLFNKNFKTIPDIRLLGVAVSDFINGNTDIQLSFFDTPKTKDLDKVMLKIRNKYGYSSIVKANNLYDKKIANTFNDEYDNKEEK